ncbi:MAG TPA: DUF3332 family protein [Kofleriaceae bacterium]|nr:DUF3332 family protein [Kofleriaceae bacterium]
MTKLGAFVLAATLATATVATQPGCYGSYGAFSRLHDWNGKVSGDKWARSAIHLGLWIVPVYELLLLGDFLIFNQIEFITGENPFD